MISMKNNEYRYYIRRTHMPEKDIVVLELADIRGVPVFDFKPGQYVMISYRNKYGRMQEKHAFSIASSPLKKGCIRLGIRTLGKFTTGLSRLEEGHEIFVSGPFGNFVFDEKKHSQAVFIAGGIGITPFISSLGYSADKNLPNKMSLLYSSRTLNGTTFFEEILEMERRNKNIRAMFSITEEKLNYKSDRIINGRISAETISNFIGHPYGKTFFLCGPVPFMDAMRKNLASIGVHESQIETEEFSMISDASFWLRTRNLAYALGISAAMFALSFYVIYHSAKKNVADTSATIVPAPENITQDPPSNPPGAPATINQNQQPKNQLTAPATPAVPKPVPRTRVS